MLRLPLKTQNQFSVSNIIDIYVDTPIGAAQITGNIDGIQAVSVLDTKVVFTDLSDLFIPQPLVDCARQLQEYFSGQRTDFDLLLRPQGTAFQQRVWQSLTQIPHGKTTTYLNQAKELGDVKAIRAVASANGKNPLWILVPCHRVVGSDGSLTGYAGGVWRKKWLLEHESGCKQQTLF